MGLTICIRATHLYCLIVGQVVVALWLTIALVAGLLVAGDFVIDLIGGIL